MFNKKLLIGVLVCFISIQQPLFALSLNKGTNPVARALYAIGIGVTLPFALTYVAIRNAIHSHKTSKENRLHLSMRLSINDTFSTINSFLCPTQKENLLRFITAAKEVAAVHKQMFEYEESLKNGSCRDVCYEKKMISEYQSKMTNLEELKEALILKQMIVQEAQRHYTKTAIPLISAITLDKYFDKATNLLKYDLTLQEYSSLSNDCLVLGKDWQKTLGYYDKLVTLEASLQHV